MSFIVQFNFFIKIMRMNRIFLGTVALSLLVACSEQELLVNEVEEECAPLGVEAEVSSGTAGRSRTSTENNRVSFTNGDKIGFYMPEAETSGQWTYQDQKWTTDDSYVWPDKSSTLNFCAYYPFVQAESRTSITMPDLSKQDGTVANIGKYDFLVARCSSNYAKRKGIVSFTGEEAFQHVSSLVAITLKTGADTKQAELTEISLKAKGMVTTSTYHFAEMAEDDGVTVSQSAVDELTLSGLSAEIPLAGQSYMFIVNPLTNSETLDIAVKYNRGDKSFTAATQISTKEMAKGSMSKLTISIKKSGLVVEGNTVEDWTENSLGEIIVEESESQQ